MTEKYPCQFCQDYIFTQLGSEVGRLWITLVYDYALKQNPFFMINPSFQCLQNLKDLENEGFLTSTEHGVRNLVCDLYVSGDYFCCETCEEERRKIQNDLGEEIG